MLNFVLPGSGAARAGRAATRVAIALVVLPGSAVAQGASPASPPRGGDFRDVGLTPAPRSRCGGFWHAELRGYAPFSTQPRVITSTGGVFTSDAFGKLFGWEMGHSRNVGAAWALGGSVFADIGEFDEDLRWGVRARLRYWLPNGHAVDVAPGFIRSSEDGAATGQSARGATADARYVVPGVGFISLRYDALHFPAIHNDWWSDPGGWHDMIAVGIGTDARPALWTTGVMLAAYAVALGWALSLDS